jgi:hypothetical protein
VTYQAHTPWNTIIAIRTGAPQITNRLYPKKDSTNRPHPGPIPTQVGDGRGIDSNAASCQRDSAHLHHDHQAGGRDHSSPSHPFGRFARLRDSPGTVETPVVRIMF